MLVTTEGADISEEPSGLPTGYVLLTLKSSLRCGRSRFWFLCRYEEAA